MSELELDATGSSVAGSDASRSGIWASSIDRQASMGCTPIDDVELPKAAIATNDIQDDIEGNSQGL